MAGAVVLHFPQTKLSYEKELEIGKSIEAGREVDERYDLNLATYFRGPTERISRRHFKISNTSTGFFLTDLKSTNRTRINQELCSPQKPFRLRDGDTIQVTKHSLFKIKVSIDSDPSRTAIEEADDIASYHTQIIPGLALYLDEQTSIFFTTRTDLPKWNLTPLENRLLNYFYQHIGRASSLFDIASDVWDYPDMSYDAIRQTVKKLRQKLDELSLGAGRRYLRTVNGFGYKLLRE